MRVLLGVTGSVAAVRAERVLSALRATHEVQVVLTKPAMRFWDPPTGDVPIWRDSDEWNYKQGQPVLHITLRDWAEAFLIAPCSANSLAHLAHGLAGNLLTTVARAWPVTKPLVLAPAMNTQMWEHPATHEQLTKLGQWYGKRLTIVQPVVKTLACGETGIGAMAETKTILQAMSLLSP